MEQKAAECEHNLAIRAFFDGWRVYQSIMAQNYLSHREVYGALQRFIFIRLGRPFSLVDCGCGDASYISRALKDTLVERYTGVDLSQIALSLARENLAALDADCSLVRGDFARAAASGFPPCDIVWIGLSLHHLFREQKLSFFQSCLRSLKPDGCVMVFDPFRREQETRDAFHMRWWQMVQSEWTNLDNAVKHGIHQHVQDSDYPESIPELREI